MRIIRIPNRKRIHFDECRRPPTKLGAKYAYLTRKTRLTGPVALSGTARPARDDTKGKPRTVAPASLAGNNQARCPSHSKGAAVINQLLCSGPVALSGTAYPARDSTKASLRSCTGPWHVGKKQSSSLLQPHQAAPPSGQGLFLAGDSSDQPAPLLRAGGALCLPRRRQHKGQTQDRGACPIGRKQSSSLPQPQQGGNGDQPAPLLKPGGALWQRLPRRKQHKGQFKVLPRAVAPASLARSNQARCPSPSKRHWQAAAVINQLLCSGPVALSGTARPAGDSTKGSLRSCPGPWHLPRWELNIAFRKGAQTCNAPNLPNPNATHQHNLSRHTLDRRMPPQSVASQNN